jgi:hypothetical protein
MPVSTSPAVEERFKDADHWTHVRETLFEPAVTLAGFKPISPVSSGSEMIHANIINELQSCEMLLCDLSDHNPNVFFELGVRTSLNLPVALVAEIGTRLPFDISSVNTDFYAPELHGWEVDAGVEALAKHIRTSADKSEGQNPLWRAFGLTIQGSEAPVSDDPTTAKMDLILQKLNALETDVALSTPTSKEFRDWASPQPRSTTAQMRFTPVRDDEKLPKWLHPYWQTAKVFTTEAGDDIRTYYNANDPRTVFVNADDLAGMNLASRRALGAMAVEHGLSLVEAP